MTKVDPKILSDVKILNQNTNIILSYLTNSYFRESILLCPLMYNNINWQSDKKKVTTGKCQSLPIYFIQNSSNVEYGNYLLLPHTQDVNIPSQCIQFRGKG